jgi:hypothetical protein
MLNRGLHRSGGPASSSFLTHQPQFCQFAIPVRGRHIFREQAVLSYAKQLLGRDTPITRLCETATTPNSDKEGVLAQKYRP